MYLLTPHTLTHQHKIQLSYKKVSSYHSGNRIMNIVFFFYIACWPQYHLHVICVMSPEAFQRVHHLTQLGQRLDPGTL